MLINNSKLIYLNNKHSDIVRLQATKRSINGHNDRHLFSINHRPNLHILYIYLYLTCIKIKQKPNEYVNIMWE